MTIEELKSHKSSDIDQIPAELIKAGGVDHFALKSMNLLFVFAIRRNCLRSGRNRSFSLSIRSVIKEIVVIIGAYHFCQLCTKFYSTSCCQG